MSRWLLARSSAICRAVAYLAAVLVAAPLVYHLSRGSLAYLGLLQDDYFYYAITADKFVTLGRLTYDGTTLTNGFHPLWFLVVVLIRLVSGSLNGAFYVILAAVFVGSMVVTYELSHAFARSLGASAALAPAVALAHAVPTDIVSCCGMETAVDIPFLLWLLLEVVETKVVTSRRAARLGLIASLAVLARLDLGLLVVLLVLGWLAAARPRPSVALRLGAAFGAGGLLVPVYVLFNVIVFGSPLPVSGLAKQLVKRPGFNVGYLRGIAFHSIFGPATGITLVLGAVTVWAFARRQAQRATADGEGGATGPSLPPAALLAAATLLGFTGTFFFANALTGWVFFYWYAYPLGPALVAALTVIGVWGVPRIPVLWRERASAVFVAAATVVAFGEGCRYFVTHGLLWTVDDNGLLAMSVELAERLHDRKGVFAMGAVGGFATYLLREPVVQIEGLMSDRAMIRHVGNEDDLGPVLQQYGVDYLIVSLHRAKFEQHDGCYVITQPNAEWAGARTAKMHGELCAQPIVSFATRVPHREWSEFSSLDTAVFDLRGASWRAR